MPPPKLVTFTGPEVLQLRREVLALEQLQAGTLEGLDRETLARRLGEIAGGLAYLLDRATARREVH